MYNILLVDDEIIVREALKVMIAGLENVRAAGEAASGKEALEALESSSPDMTFLDIKIPGMNILDLIKHMKRLNPKNKIILLSDHGSSDFVFKALEMGADGYLLKPYLQKDIINLVNLYLSQASSPQMNLEQTMDQSIQDIKLIQSVINYIEKNYQKGVSLEEAAEHVHLSPFYLSKLFKKQLKINFVSYVTERKIDKAKELLETTDMPILNIALDLNYQEPNYFSKVFKKVVGVTPSEYRKDKRRSQSPLLKRSNQILNGKWYI